MHRRLRHPMAFFTRLRIVAQLLPVYLVLSLYDVFCLLCLSAHTSFRYFHTLHPQKGYTRSYAAHARRKRRIQFGLLSFGLALIFLFTYGTLLTATV